MKRLPDVFFSPSPPVSLSIPPPLSSSQNKELSYSELDLRKPKRFATFSFSGLKKRKKKHEDNFSKSVYGLNVPSLEEEVISFSSTSCAIYLLRSRTSGLGLWSAFTCVYDLLSDSFGPQPDGAGSSKHEEEVQYVSARAGHQR